MQFIGNFHNEPRTTINDPRSLQKMFVTRTLPLAGLRSSKTFTPKMSCKFASVKTVSGAPLATTSPFFSKMISSTNSAAKFKSCVIKIAAAFRFRSVRAPSETSTPDALNRDSSSARRAVKSALRSPARGLKRRAAVRRRKVCSSAGFRNRSNRTAANIRARCVNLRRFPSRKPRRARNVPLKQTPKP